MAAIDKAYHELLSTILNEGYKYEDPNRKGTYRTEIDEYTIRHDLTKGFPAITTKELHWKSVVGELIWFLRGDTNIKYLVNNGINIWNKDAYNHYLRNNKTDLSKFVPDKDFKNHYQFWLWSLKHPSSSLGELGPVYGHQWRFLNKIKDVNFTPERYVTTSKTVDQMSKLIFNLRKNPLATDHLVTAWNPLESDEMALKPCHYGFQIMVRPLTDNQKIEHLFNTGDERFSKYEDHLLGKISKEEFLDTIPDIRYGFTLKWNQRSVDTFLGLPFNIASYALLAHIIGQLTRMVPLKLVGSLSKVHIYDNAISQARQQLTRGADQFKAPTIKFSENFHKEAKKFRCHNNYVNLGRVADYVEIEDFMLEGYKSYPKLTAKMLAYNK